MDSEKRREELAAKLLRSIDEACATHPVTSGKQLADIDEMREKIALFCKEGRTGEAERLVSLCVSLIRQGEPPKE